MRLRKGSPRTGDPPTHDKRVAIFSEEPIGTSASDSPLLRLLRAAPQGIKVVLSTPGYQGGPDCQEPIPNIQLASRPSYGGSFRGFAIRAFRILPPTWRSIRDTVRNVDAVVTRFPSPVLPLVLCAARQQRKPHALYVVGDIRHIVKMSGKYSHLARKLVAGPTADLMYRISLRASRTGSVIAASRWLADSYDAPNVRCAVFHPTSVRAEDIALRDDTCQSGPPYRLLFVGRLVPVKGLTYLVRALGLLQQEGASVELEILGEGPQRQALARQAKQEGLTRAVSFVGHIPFGSELLSHYRQADVFVLPSLSEGLARVLWEAMASGLPIVATRVGGVPEIIEHGVTGLLVAPRSPRELSEAIRRLLEDPPLRQRLIRAGYATVRKHTVEYQAPIFWKHIEKLLERDAP